MLNKWLAAAVILTAAFLLTACLTGHDPSPTAATSLEVAQQVCRQRYDTRVVSRTEQGNLVQVWQCEGSKQPIEIQDWSQPQPDMNPCRTCNGDWTTHTTARFEVQSPTEATAEICNSGSSGVVICHVWHLAKTDQQWSILSKRYSPREDCKCPEPT
jgi:hypothetical protein